MPTKNILPRIILKLEVLTHAYLGVQLRDGTKHLIVLFDRGHPVHGEVDGSDHDPRATLAAMTVLVDECIDTGRHVVITAIDEGDGKGPETAKTVYSAAYLDGALVFLDPELLAASSEDGRWDDMDKLIG